MVRDRKDLDFQYIFAFDSHKSYHIDNLNLGGILDHSLLWYQAWELGLVNTYFKGNMFC